MTIETIASRLEQDIRRRGLRRGERYCTAAEASKLFSVSPVTVNRAMQLLADRKMLTRKRSRGTFVGPEFPNDHLATSIVDVLHVLMAVDYYTSQSETADSLVDCLVHTFSGAVVDIQFLPEASALANVERTVQRLKNTDVTEGLVLIRCSRPAQLCVAESGMPAVVMGLVYPGIALSSVSHDQTAVGRLMAEFAVRSGYSRCVLLTRNVWRHGDNAMLDAISQSLAAAGISLTGLTIRSTPQERDFVVDAVLEVLSESDEPTVFLCRNEFYAKTAIEVAKMGGRKLGVDFDVISGGHMPPAEPVCYARVQSKLSLTTQVERLAELLREAVERPDAPPRTVTIPVAFQEPLRRKQQK